MAEKITRREIIKRAAYIAPVVLTLAAVPAFASGGSAQQSSSSTGTSSWSSDSNASVRVRSI
jgi:hypothetical protein